MVTRVEVARLIGALLGREPRSLDAFVRELAAG